MSNGLAGGSIFEAAEEDGLERVGFLEGADDGSEGGGVPSLGGSVGGAWKNGEVGLGGGVFGFGEGRGRWEFGFGERKSEIFEQADILIGEVEVAVGGGTAWGVIGEEGITEFLVEASSVRNGESLEGGADGVRKKNG